MQRVSNFFNDQVFHHYRFNSSERENRKGSLDGREFKKEGPYTSLGNTLMIIAFAKPFFLASAVWQTLCLPYGCLVDFFQRYNLHVESSSNSKKSSSNSSLLQFFKMQEGNTWMNKGITVIDKQVAWNCGKSWLYTLPFFLLPSGISSYEVFPISLVGWDHYLSSWITMSAIGFCIYNPYFLPNAVRKVESYVIDRSQENIPTTLDASNTFFGNVNKFFNFKVSIVDLMGSREKGEKKDRLGLSSHQKLVKKSDEGSDAVLTKSIKPKKDD